MKPKVAVIGTGGTISFVGKGPLDLADYSAAAARLDASEIIARVPAAHDIADIVAVDYLKVASYEVAFPEWKQIAAMAQSLVERHRDLAGIVITHGTASLEETAFALNLTLTIDLPVVVVGSQRPIGGLSSDAGLNLINAIRVAGSPQARGRGVLVVLNDEIQAARDVTKTSTFRLQTFRSPDFGCLGHVDADAVAFYRKPERRHMPDSEFKIGAIDALPRVDIVYSYVGSNGDAVRAFVDAGAEGIVSAGFAPGLPGSADGEALRNAVARGIIVVQSTRVGSGRVVRTTKLREAGFLSADNLNPQKARLLLAFALTVSRDPDTIQEIFTRY